MSKRCMKDEWHGQCCCNCKNHRPDYRHCSVDRNFSKESCVCSQIKGWICTAPEIGRLYSGWSRHGMCEMWDEGWTAEAIEVANLIDRKTFHMIMHPSWREPLPREPVP